MMEVSVFHVSAFNLRLIVSEVYKKVTAASNIIIYAFQIVWKDKIYSLFLYFPLQV